MIAKQDRKDKKGRTILEETDTNNLCLDEMYTDSIALEEDFADMQVLICNILEALPVAPLNTTELSYISTLIQICFSILEKIHTRIQ